jgi:processing peptidase subunit beta
MPRSEFARRISAIDAGHITRAATRHFWDKVFYMCILGYFCCSLGTNPFA